MLLLSMLLSEDRGKILLYKTLDDRKKNHNANTSEPIACFFSVHFSFYHNLEGNQLRLGGVVCEWWLVDFLFTRPPIKQNTAVSIL